MVTWAIYYIVYGERPCAGLYRRSGLPWLGPDQPLGRAAGAPGHQLLDRLPPGCESAPDEPVGSHQHRGRRRGAIVGFGDFKLTLQKNAGGFEAFQFGEIV